MYERNLNFKKNVQFILVWTQLVSARILHVAIDLKMHETLRKPIVESGDALVVDWLLNAVGSSRPRHQNLHRHKIHHSYNEPTPLKLQL